MERGRACIVDGGAPRLDAQSAPLREAGRVVRTAGSAAAPKDDLLATLSPELRTPPTAHKGPLNPDRLIGTVVQSAAADPAPAVPPEVPPSPIAPFGQTDLSSRRSAGARALRLRRATVGAQRAQIRAESSPGAGSASASPVSQGEAAAAAGIGGRTGP